ncbi:MAG: ribonuclease HII [Candidatus Izimaplasma sp.]|nr:ribonuclease HII [Candidatus Izimaplasma bacterium]
MYQYENNLYKSGHKLIAGTDEVGRGPLAGPVVAAAVILNPDITIEGLNDSKKLSETKRNELSKQIKEKAIASTITHISPREIDQINIYKASQKAMIKAIEKLDPKPDYILSDAMQLPGIPIPCMSIIKGDSKSASIAAASILAKVNRDAYMVKLAKKYPKYAFDQHKGYPTKKHLEALKKYGVLDVHRKSFAPVHDQLYKQQKLDI